MKINNQFLTGIIIIGVIGCTPVSKLKLPEQQTLPEQFISDNAGDSLTVADISWREFFKDQHLIALIDAALQQNWDIKQAVQRIEMARAQFRKAKGALLPEVQAQITASGDRYGDYTMTGVGNFDTNLSGNITDDQKVNTDFTPDFFVGARSSWEIDIWKRLRSEREAAQFQVLAAERAAKLTQTIIVAEVSNLYFELLALDKELEVIRHNIELQTNAVEIVEVQKTGGRATELAVQQFKAQLLNTKALETGVKDRIVVIENQLNVLLGRYPQPITRTGNIKEAHITERLATGLPVDILLRRPDIQEAELLLNAQKANVKAARAALLPRLTLNPYIGFNAFNAGLLFDPASLGFGVLGGLTQPVLNRAALRSAVLHQNAQAMHAFYEYEKVIQSGVAEVTTNVNSIQQLKQRLIYKQEESGLLNEAIETSRELYLAGYANYLEVIMAQRSALEVEIDLIQTHKEVLRAGIALYRSLGGGWQ